MKECIPFAQLCSTGLLTQITVGAIVPGTFKASPKVKGTNIVAPSAVGAGFFGISKLHGTRAGGLQQHLNQGVRASLFAEVFLVVHKQPHKPNKECRCCSNDRKVSGCDQPQLVAQWLEKGKDDFRQQ